jgi:hypothetical protein
MEEDIRAGSACDVVVWSEVLALKAETSADLNQALTWRKSLLDLPAVMLRGVPFEFPTWYGSLCS